MSPPNTKKRLNLYQRVLLRALFRFPKTYTTIPRGSAKSFIQLLAYMLMAVLYPNIKLSILAETKEQSAGIIADKYEELTTEWFPFLKNEIEGKPTMQRDIAIINFKNGSTISNLANAQTTKGKRRHRGSVDESARLNNAMWKDAVEPVFSLQRWSGEEKDPCELNGQIIYFTTSGFKGTTEFTRTLSFVDEMTECKGAFVFGANWELPVHFGLLTRKRIMEIKNDETTSPVAFLCNYESIWVGAGEGALVNMDKVQALRTSELIPHVKAKDANTEYIISLDIARSEAKNNNQSAYTVFKLNRNSSGMVQNVEIVNIIVPPNGLNFRQQTLILKRLSKKYNDALCVIDANGVGKGVLDECLHETEDIETGEILPCWDCMNVEMKPDIENSPKMVYALNASGINNSIIVNFWGYVENARIKFLPTERSAKLPSKITETDKIDMTIALMNTEKLMEQLSNLKVEKTENGAFKIRQVTKKIDKDIYSALVYGLYFIQYEINKPNQTNEVNYTDYIYYN